MGAGLMGDPIRWLVT